MKSLLTLNAYIWRYRKLMLYGLLTVLLTNFFAIYPAQMVRDAIDTVSVAVTQAAELKGTPQFETNQQEVIHSLIRYGSLIILMAVLRGIFLFLVRQTIIIMSRRVEFDLRNDLFAHLQKLTLSFYRRNNTGDLMARVTEDVSRVRMYLGPGIMYTLNTAVLVLMVIFTMFSVNPELTMYALLPLPILSYTIFKVESLVLKRSDDIQKQLSHLTTFTQEMFSGIRVVKAYVREREATRKFGEAADAYKTKSLKMATIDALFFPFVVTLIGLSNIMVLWIGGQKVIAGEITVGNIAEFLIYINLITWPIISVGWVSTLIQRAAASQARLNVLMDEKPDLTFPETAQGGAGEASLVFDNVSFTYPDTGIKALQGVNFSLKPGQKLGILGPTGSGKSTLCALVPRLYDVQEGSIRFSGRDVREYSAAGLRNSIGYAPQDVFLFSDTIANNIAFGKTDATQPEIEAAAQQAVIHHNIADFPQGYETIVGERGVTLSGGQKQRISVARAWVRRPKLLILDDVLSAVDTRTEETMLANLREYRTAHPDTATIMVAHRISCLQDSDLILVLENGRITEQGTHESLLAANGYYARIYDKQLTEGAAPAEDKNLTTEALLA